MSKVLAVAYSYTGTSRHLAQLLVAQQPWTLAEVREASPRSGFVGTWHCLLDSFFHRCPQIRYDGPNPIDLTRSCWSHRSGPIVWPGRCAASSQRSALRCATSR